MPRKWIVRLAYLAILCACMFAARPRTTANASSKPNDTVVAMRQAAASSRWVPAVADACRQISCMIQLDRTLVDASCQQDWLSAPTTLAISAALNQQLLALDDDTENAKVAAAEFEFRAIDPAIDRQAAEITSVDRQRPAAADVKLTCESIVPAWPVQTIVATTPIENVVWAMQTKSIREIILPQHRRYWELSNEEAQRDYLTRIGSPPEEAKIRIENFSFFTSGAR